MMLLPLQEVVAYECEDMQGNRYAAGNNRKVPKYISAVQEPLKTGQKFSDEWQSRELMKKDPTKIYIQSLHGRKFKIVEIQELNKNTRIIKFRRAKKPTPRPTKDDEEYKQMLMSTNLRKDRLLGVLEGMLTNCFTSKELNYLLNNTPEFIMDEHWMFIKSGNKAFRV